MDYRLETPIAEAEIRKLRAGDQIHLTGRLITARDEAHLRSIELFKEGLSPPVEFKGNGVFHCGPIMRMKDGGWEVVAAGPTTSARMEIFQDVFIKIFRPAIIIGKGGMGERTLLACKEYGCVYGVFTGGAALLAARGIARVEEVFWLEELGMPECLWVYRVEDFGPVTVAIDTYGVNLTEEVSKRIESNKQRILEEIDAQ
jgi:tartrate/fumarate subfamily iron-sulfur-dependent hydro-lyase beta chain